MNNQGLHAGCSFYRTRTDVYEALAQAEDAPGWISRYLTGKVIGQDVLDLGCGTGKYLSLLAVDAKSYIALDAAPAVLARAQECGKHFKNVSFVLSDAASTGIAARSVDLVISCWVVGTIPDRVHQESVLREIERVLRPGGKALFVENDIGGEFEEIRARYPNSERTEGYNRWLEERGFRAVTRFRTHFSFPSLEEAQFIFAAIWGKEAGERVTGASIEHRVIVFERIYTGHHKEFIHA